MPLVVTDFTKKIPILVIGTQHQIIIILFRPYTNLFPWQQQMNILDEIIKRTHIFFKKLKSLLRRQT